ncbi:hypothetical protein CPC735_015330 [Coccidioides posadasii C735 delta SOWgp]|uniref:DUF159 domain protein n=1 Tax=Coccidioides posadasii (strain C735) TaxID=222929 RepID=C5PCX4_COCP7|nr:hypothetical protein CPC735_015330 [Coccidioides posadasii C735 delta SOWgp]EER24935.1 hypothetical protein CPC735_015330 [Coccidioides posadasii C735 delta SOWgp]|eukprot:XP_003067080.1 hypothetical protein CPC735_015330 [Coccidioides posadasii C735 delta SOWgp]
MCGRYALGVRLAFIRHQLQRQGQQVDEVPDDDDVRETYNFAPGYYGAVYRADTPDQGGYNPAEAYDGGHHAAEHKMPEDEGKAQLTSGGIEDERVKYKLQSMKWGLVPFWTKRSPNYGSLMKTINCRDDSLAENKGMWTSMKKRKRCVVVCQGFYEWLKKGKEKIPHFIRRKDGDLMCFAGLWDCVKYDDSDEKLYTFTIITTSSNAYLSFIHDRMPVILEPGSPEMAAWLDPHRTTWTKELQSMLKPYQGELEAYPVNRDVGKVGNNSPDFIIPINSQENKKNIANFFANTQKKAKAEGPSSQPGKVVNEIEQLEKDLKFKSDLEPESQEISKDKGPMTESAGTKRGYPVDEAADVKPAKIPRTGDTSKSPTKRAASISPVKATIPGRKTRSATSNGSAAGSGKTADAKRAARGSQRITSFFKK